MQYWPQAALLATNVLHVSALVTPYSAPAAFYAAYLAAPEPLHATDLGYISVLERMNKEAEKVEPGQRFQIMQGLGSGSFGTVRLVKDTSSDKLLAMKVLNRRDASKYVEAEIVNHSLLRHPHIVHFREVYLEQDSLCIVMEYANGGSLFNLVRTQRRLKESMARWFFQQLILAVDYCHKRGVANRDIKLENLLLHMEEGLPHPLLKMCDFGYSKADFRSAAKSQVGTLSYMAPEVMKSCGAYYDAKVADVWSCGVVLYVMLYGIYPFDNLAEDVGLSEAHKVRRMLERMEKEAYVLNPSVPVSEECLDMLRGLLNPNPEGRYTIERIMDHPWFNRKLPPQAREMNIYYLNLPVPPEYQRPEQIAELLEQARAVSSGVNGGH